MEKEKIIYTKLGNLVNDSFKVLESYGYKWKKWNSEAKRFEIADKYEEGFRKIYTIKTDKGNLDLGSGQLGTLLEAVYSKGKADLNGRSFAVKSNGKTGMDIRYFFNPIKEEIVDTTPDDDEVEDEIDLDDIPF